MSSSPSATILPLNEIQQQPPPLAIALSYLRKSVPYLLPLPGHIFNAAKLGIDLFRTSTYALIHLLTPISPLPLILYLLAPISFFIHIVLHAFVILPWGIVEYLLDALYPVYVLLGVACITGVTLGLVGRLLARCAVELATGVGKIEKEPEVVEEPAKSRVKFELES